MLIRQKPLERTYIMKEVQLSELEKEAQRLKAHEAVSG